MKENLNNTTILKSFVDSTYDLISEHGDMSIEIQARDLERLCDLASIGLQKTEDDLKSNNKSNEINSDDFFIIKVESCYSLREVGTLNAILKDLIDFYPDNIVRIISTQVLLGDDDNYDCLLATVEWKGEPYINTNGDDGEITG